MSAHHDSELKTSPCPNFGRNTGKINDRNASTTNARLEDAHPLTWGFAIRFLDAPCSPIRPATVNPLVTKTLPWRTSMEVRSLDMTPEEMIAADLEAAAAYQEPDRASTAGASLDEYTLDQQVDIYWSVGTVGTMDVDQQATVDALDATSSSSTSSFVAWRDNHHYSVLPAGLPQTCEGAALKQNVFSNDKSCWKWSWMWHSGCSPSGLPFKGNNTQNGGGTNTTYLANKDHWCPNGKWPLTASLTYPMMQWDSVRRFWEPTPAAQAWLDSQFASGWNPVSPTGW